MAPHILRLFTEWGISLKSRISALLNSLKATLWFNIFLNVGIIFAVFMIVLTVANSTLLTRFFGHKQKQELVSELNRVAALNLNDKEVVVDTLSEISENNLEVEIYTTDGSIIYTTQGRQLMDYFKIGNSTFSMSHDRFTPTYRQELKGGITYEEAVRSFDKSEFMLCRKMLDSRTIAEVRVKRQLITNSAEIAAEFAGIIAILCLALSIVWIYFFARRFSRPLTTMNDITRDMADLKFERRIETDRSDEIGQLASSINEMSNSLSVALGTLKENNARLRDEIELERSLDKMRREFVADVSHELKTPIAIISGYAEGLKLNINAKSREEYCNTIIEESARMNRLVISILELSKYQSNQIPINPECFDIGVLAADMANRIIREGRTVSVEIPENTLVCADELQIEQVLKAYLENAKSHTPAGGSVRLFAAENGDKIRVSVENTGENIAEDIMPNIWQSFYRGDSSHKRAENRFGLGLSIVGAIMKMHNCDCGVYNTPSGVCFWFDAKKA